MLTVNGFSCALVYHNNQSVELPQYEAKIWYEAGVATCRVPAGEMTQTNRWPFFGYLIECKPVSVDWYRQNWVVHFLREGIPILQSRSASQLAADPGPMEIMTPYVGQAPSTYTQLGTIEVIVMPPGRNPISLIQGHGGDASTLGHIAYFRFECAIDIPNQIQECQANHNGYAHDHEPLAFSQSYQEHRAHEHLASPQNQDDVPAWVHTTEISNDWQPLRRRYDPKHPLRVNYYPLHR
ncbi:hypothetical protein CPB84DRAFT_1763850 [Gymnopilus junonius]|uniref:Uncharacterized protein n=1 Tax=Gymnopilus junonius TaxID=109634 RepID=A0A9P5P0W0_GYMJU|nr:hypothetical protein CPB84DRAFT_1763850 [Gymnopilus junonius]